MPDPHRPVPRQAPRTGLDRMRVIEEYRMDVRNDVARSSQSRSRRPPDRTPAAPVPDFGPSERHKQTSAACAACPNASRAAPAGKEQPKSCFHGTQRRPACSRPAHGAASVVDRVRSSTAPRMAAPPISRSMRTPVGPYARFAGTSAASTELRAPRPEAPVGLADDPNLHPGRNFIAGLVEGLALEAVDQAW